jgi:hypothetical protein
MSNRNPVLRREFAKVRRIPGAVPHQARTVTLGDLLSHNTVQLIKEETGMSPEELASVLVSVVPNGVVYTLVVYAQSWRKKLPIDSLVGHDKSELVECYAELQVPHSEKRMHVYQFLGNLQILVKADEPSATEQWWEIPDEVVIGIDRVFTSADAPAVAA